MRIKTLLAVLLLSTNLFAQNSPKNALNHDVYDGWNDIAKPAISNNGKLVIYEVNPQKSDGVLWVYNDSTKGNHQFPRGYNAKFSPQSNFIVFQVKPQFEITRQAKLAKKKADEMPKDSIKVFVLTDSRIYSFPNAKSYSIPDDEGNFIAILTDLTKNKEANDSTKKESGKKSSTSKKSTTGKLIILNPINNFSLDVDSVNHYAISKNGQFIAYGKLVGDSVKLSSLYIFNTKNHSTLEIFKSNGEIAKINFDDKGTQLAFVFTSDTGKVKEYSLYYWESKNRKVQLAANKSSNGMPKGWMVSQHFEPYFSANGKRVFFGTSLIPLKEEKDTVLDEEKTILDVWSWTDTLLQTQQKVRLKDADNKSYLAVYHINEKRMVQLANDSIDRVKVLLKGDAPYALVSCNKPYLYSMTWESPLKSDYYMVEVNTGKYELLLKGLPYPPQLSPSGKYVAYYNPADSSWYTWSRKEGKTINQTKGLPVNFYDEQNDIPQIPRPYGYAGWVENDKYFLVYDKYDIWALDPTGKLKPTCITNNSGRILRNRYRIIQTNDNDYLSYSNNELVEVFNNTTKQSGFGLVRLDQLMGVDQKLFTNHKYRFVSKAKNSKTLIWQRESFTEYRDLWISGMEFSNPDKISNANPKITDYKWGMVKLYKWIDFNRDSVEGLLYLPEGFNPNRKYPMMVYFYETHTDNLHNFYDPKPSRSVISPSMYVSNDYIVFMPNIKYQIGYPGQSAYNAVISGTMAIIKEGFVDKDRIGVQGQSWGGYQVAYLITQTNLFRAASAGAPVSNMTSAYGGIRWESGMARMFQYEHTQSRIGGTLWDKPLLFIENSPLFHVQKVNTPLLIRHDDADGAVPWYQGIELFLALRRLGKPVWMINYNEDAHNLKKWANRVDWSIRMQQFFDYYLKDEPMPTWMKGIPQTKKGKYSGYEFAE
ncbi:MAG TPA: S9 family peptidase [Bacteroidales bacterium]|nr:S9 family peptidase [Bacteroidales bacterium]